MDDGFRLYLIQNGLSKVTVRHYTDSVKAYYRAYSDISEANIGEYLVGILEASTPANYNRHLKALRHLCTYNGLPPFKNLKRLKEKPKVRALLTDTQIQQMISGEDKYSVAFAIHAYTGCRTSDVLKLQKDSVDLSLNCIYFQHGKGGKSRVVPILEPLKDKLERYIETCTTPYLFEYRGHPIGQDMYTRVWREKMNSLGIHSSATPHALRHSFLTNSLGNGANLYAIQDIVGHTSAETTRKYYHGNLELMKKAAAKLPLAQKELNPEVLADQFCELVDEFLGKDSRFEKSKLMEVKAKVYESIKK